MKVSMDGLRRSGINAYNKLVRELKKNIKDGDGPIDPERIEECMEDLRLMLSVLANMYHEGEEGFAVLEKYHLEDLAEN